MLTLAVILDLALVILSTALLARSIRRITACESKTIADYALAIVWVFNCLPVLLDLTVGLPNYSLFPWWSYLSVAMGDIAVRMTYAAYMLTVTALLGVYAARQNAAECSAIRYTASGSRLFRGPALVLVALVPVVLVLASGSLGSFARYASLSSRVSGSVYEMIGISELIALFAFLCWYYTDRSRKPSSLVALTYFGALLWIDGKRYILATILLLVVYFQMNSLRARPLRFSRKVIVLGVVGLFLGFYVWYSLGLKSTAQSLDALYLAFRLDFGRDDVTKFVLYREIVEAAPILPYRGATLLSTFLFFVPRALWHAKPLPHYRYLTAAVLSVDPAWIPAGLTPSVFETAVANMGVVIGVVASCAALLGVCRLADRCTSVPRRALYLILVAAMLTQSLDAIGGVLVLLVLGAVPRILSRLLRSGAV